MNGRVTGIGLVLGLLLMISGSSVVFAQCATSTSFTGSLRVRNGIGCVPLTVQTGSDLIGVQNVRYVYEYDGQREMPVTTAGTYTYKKPGEYRILQLSEKEGLPLRACATVIVYDTIPPTVNLTACGTQVTLRVSDSQMDFWRYDYMVVRWDDGRVDTLKTIPVAIGHTYSTVSPRRIQVQGFHRYGQCGGTTTRLFVPNQPAVVRGLDLLNAQTGQLRIDNPSGTPLTVERRLGNGVYTKLPGTLSGNAPSTNVTLDSAEITCFRVVPTSNCPGESPSPELCYTPPNQAVADAVYLPDAFSPNDDGVNDTFGPVGKLPPGDFRLTVADRWGRIVFSTDDPLSPWNGVLNGQSLPTGTYAYQLEIRLSGGQISRRSGRVQLIR
ncbi:gliding motility-associated C-terminal domain-containing protein [Fibrisoma montanum]|uniref:Gliding motility-associated C-terminal domain-containing protein n=1 Tax=Fibrisoma montanum TaxID=2305895 RepID=A0A418M4D9_9BACT|nr:gliding motility-associated C-terminal domain-containing protein [Fibrisoma montanum]RIV20611.1 gliding motility-associated C-terminal domain-containing protein [Fibrisoma montanum]